MGWDMKGDNKWGNWTGTISVKKVGPFFTVIRDVSKKAGGSGSIGGPSNDKIDLVKVRNEKHLKSKTAARLWAINWMKTNPHYRGYISKKEVRRLDNKFRGRHSSGFRSLKF